MAYTEFYFTDIFWPDFREADLLKAIAEYQRRERRFGMTSEQIGGGRKNTPDLFGGSMPQNSGSVGEVRNRSRGGDQ
jgi:hypothetical protein